MSASVFESRLPDPGQRFLSAVVEHALATGRRTAADFLQRFPPSAIMAGLEDDPQRRANILVVCTGVRLKIAVKKSAESCAEDLQIALDEEETDAETVVNLFEPDERVLYLDPEALWAYATEGDFVRDSTSAEARAVVAFVLERALAEGLVTAAELVDGVSIAALAELLPREQLGRALAAAVRAGEAGRPFDARALLELVPPGTLSTHVPLPDLWDRVILPQVAARHGLAGTAESPAPLAPPAPLAAPGGGDDPEGAKSKAKARAKSRPPPPAEKLDIAIDDVLDD